MISYLNGIIDLAFFIYNANRQINTTLKLQKLLNSIVIYVRSDYMQCKSRVARFAEYYRNSVLKKMQDELSLVFMTTDKYSPKLSTNLKTAPMITLRQSL